MSRNTRKQWDTYVKEADKPPFELEVSADQVISIHAPTGAQIIDAQKAAASGDVETQLRLICDDAADDLLPLIKAAPGDAMRALLEDIMAHFGYATGEGSASRN